LLVEFEPRSFIVLVPRRQDLQRTRSRYNERASRMAWKACSSACGLQEYFARKPIELFFKLNSWRVGATVMPLSNAANLAGHHRRPRPKLATNGLRTFIRPQCYCSVRGLYLPIYPSCYGGSFRTPQADSPPSLNTKEITLRYKTSSVSSGADGSHANLTCPSAHVQGVR